MRALLWRAWRAFIRITRLYCLGCGERKAIIQCVCGCSAGCQRCVDYAHHYVGVLQ